MTREQEFIHELLVYCSYIESECYKGNLNFVRKIRTIDNFITTEFTEHINTICKKYSDVYNKLLIDYNNEIVSDEYKIKNSSKFNNIELGVTSNTKRTHIIPPKCKPSR